MYITTIGRLAMTIFRIFMGIPPTRLLVTDERDRSRYNNTNGALPTCRGNNAGRSATAVGARICARTRIILLLYYCDNNIIQGDTDFRVIIIKQYV